MPIHDRCKILLASGSPRRRDLLRSACFDVRVVNLNLQEDYPSDLPSPSVAGFLAEQKSKAARQLMTSGEVLITADTIVLHQKKILNKPKNKNEAEKMLAALSDDRHEVITGVSIYSKYHAENWSVSSLVDFYPINSEEIDFYIQAFDPFDKAGSYGIQDWIGWCKVKRIEGSYTNIMGLPLAEIYQALHRHC